MHNKDVVLTFRNFCLDVACELFKKGADDAKIQNVNPYDVAREDARHVVNKVYHEHLSVSNFKLN